MSDDRAPEIDDDGPNPLPPAIDAEPVSSLHRSATDEDNPIRMARGASRSPVQTNRRTVRDTFDPAGPKVNNQADWPVEQEPRPIPEEILPRGRANPAESYEPTIVIDGSEADNAPSRSSKLLRRAAPPSSAGSRSSDSASDHRSTDANDSSDAGGSDDSRARPTWREISFNRADVPIDESVRRTNGDAASKNPQVITLTGQIEAAKPRLSQLLSGTKPPLDPAVGRTVCQINPAEGRVVDFQLPGLDGKMVSLHDIDADLILLDFWGSWCKQCKESIPHLAELQNRFGGKRLQVVGIACEKGASIQDRRASAMKGALDLGIKYPVVVSSMDGSCPVQKGLQVKFYPTMVLMDRNGRLIERMQGVTPITLARIDQAVETALRNPGARLEDEGIGR